MIACPRPAANSFQAPHIHEVASFLVEGRIYIRDDSYAFTLFQLPASSLRSTTPGFPHVVIRILSMSMSVIVVKWLFTEESDPSVSLEDRSASGAKSRTL